MLILCLLILSRLLPRLLYWPNSFSGFQTGSLQGLLPKFDCHTSKTIEPQFYTFFTFTHFPLISCLFFIKRRVKMGFWLDPCTQWREVKVSCRGLVSCSIQQKWSLPKHWLLSGLFPYHTTYSFQAIRCFYSLFSSLCLSDRCISQY